MVGSIVSLLIGLILLVVAGWLLKRASSQSESRGSASAAQSVPSSFQDAPQPGAGAPSGADEPGGEPAPGRGGASGGAGASTAGTSGVGSEAGDNSAELAGAQAQGVAPDAAGASGEGAEPQAAADAGAAAERGEGAEPGNATESGEALAPSEAQAPAGQQPEQGSGRPESVRAESAHGGLFASIRRRRRQWAAANGAEFTREDIDLPQEWPRAALQAVNVSPIRALAKDVVSGFWEGHEYHVADLGEGTVMAMRRAAASPVTVHYSRDKGVSEGMRRSELLDQPPYVAYTSDVRALDRMLDVRVEDGLAALSQVASDVVWGEDWVVISISRRLEFSVWEQVLPQLLALAHAAMVLPPRVMSVPLELDNADQTRALPGVEITLRAGRGAQSADKSASGKSNSQDAAAPGSRNSKEKAGAEGDKPKKSRPGYLRAVGSVLNNPAETQSENEQKSQVNSQPAQPEVFAGQESEESLTSDRPHIERPASPVEFPSRYDRSREGNATSEDFADSTLDLDSQRIPRLGEDPDHISGSVGQRPQVIRVEFDDEPAIFNDELSATAAERRGQRRRSGRHRAPDARHALPAPIEPVEADIEVVEAEVVEPEDSEDSRGDEL